MDCKTVIKYMDDYLDGELEATIQESLQQHLTVCPECKNLVSLERDMRAALRELPVPTPDADFVDQVFSRAISRAKHRPRGYSGWVRLAASIAMVVAIGYSLKVNWQSSRIDVTQVSVAMNVEEEIRLVFNSNENLDGVTFSLEMPKNIELAGYGDKRKIIWQGDLSKGRNLLVLPVIARDSTGGLLVAGIRHGQNNRQFNLQLTVDQSADDDQPVEKINIHKMSVIPI